MPPFGELLRQLRIAAGLTQAELAEQADISVRSISDMERGGSHRPRWDTLELLATALHLSPEEHAAFVAMGRRHPAPPSTSGEISGGREPISLPIPRLPTPPIPLIGRNQAIADACALLDDGNVRLLTLCGPGGVGKTHLALVIGAQMADRFPDGVMFISLAAVRDPGLVIQTIAQETGVHASGPQSLTSALYAHLRDRQVLLLLDNFEHVERAATFLPELLSACPSLKILVTSRVPLHLRGEWRQTVPPLAVPDRTLSSSPSVERLGQIGSVALFTQRAAAAVPGFELTAENALAIAEICRRLDGLPLAIELAAPRIALFSPQTLLTRLERSLPILTSGARDLPDRQRTLRDTLMWSYDLLSPSAQTLFRRLSIFAGGCMVDAVEALYAHVGEPPGHLLDDLTTLLDHYLVTRNQLLQADPRIGMLETLRELARELAEASGEVSALAAAHATHYLAVAEEAEPHLKGSDQRVWLEKLECEHDNIRAALRWVVDERQVERAMRGVGALWRFWGMHGHLSEGRRWLDEILALAGPPGASADGSLLMEQMGLLANVYHGAGFLAFHQGDYVTARARYEACLALRRLTHHTLGIAQMYNNLGEVAREQGDYQQAAHLYEQSLELKRELGDTHGIASTLNNLGLMRRQLGDPASAARLMEESLSLWRQLGDEQSVARTLTNLGVLAREQGDYPRATTLINQGLECCHALNDVRGIMYALGSLGEVALASGDTERALALHLDVIDLAWSMGHLITVAAGLENVAQVWCVCGQYARAVELLGAASTIRETHVAPLEPLERVAVDRTSSMACTAIGENQWAVAWTSGRAMTVPQALAEAALGQPGNFGRAREIKALQHHSP